MLNFFGGEILNDTTPALKEGQILFDKTTSTLHIDTETRRAQVLDDTKLPLSGGTMGGDISFIANNNKDSPELSFTHHQSGNSGYTKVIYSSNSLVTNWEGSSISMAANLMTIATSDYISFSTKNYPTSIMIKGDSVLRKGYVTIDADSVSIPVDAASMTIGVVGNAEISMSTRGGTSQIALGNNGVVKGLMNPYEDDCAANKAYVDNRTSWVEW